MNERQPNSSENKDCSGWQRRDTRLQLLMWPSTQRIGKDINASSLLTRRAVDVISAAFFSAMTGDRDDEPAAMDLSMIAVALTPSWLVLIFNNYASLAIFVIIRSFFCFVFEHETMHTIRVLEWLRLLLHTAERTSGKKLRQKHINEWLKREQHECLVWQSDKSKLLGQTDSAGKIL